MKLQLGLQRLSAALKKTLSHTAGKNIEHILILPNAEPNGRMLHASTLNPDKTLDALRQAIQQIEKAHKQHNQEQPTHARTI